MAYVFYYPNSDELLIETTRYVTATVTNGCAGCVFDKDQPDHNLCMAGANKWCETSTRNIIWVKKEPKKALSVDDESGQLTDASKQKFAKSTGYDADQIIKHRKEIMELLKKFEFLELLNKLN